ncbi:MAG: hypothetical protein A2Y66_02720 [Nitrospirae bacterium RBG_13_41_22]|nr:MAG: hypothetical protein A2Y66_02720 [Nitrospirae bacterium RBG_13_41_22]
MASADSAAHPFLVYGVNMMNRRKFLKLIVLGGIFSLFSRKVEAERKPEQKLKEAMFWRKLDNE